MADRIRELLVGSPDLSVVSHARGLQPADRGHQCLGRGLPDRAQGRPTPVGLVDRDAAAVGVQCGRAGQPQPGRPIGGHPLPRRVAGSELEGGVPRSATTGHVQLGQLPGRAQHRLTQLALRLVRGRHRPRPLGRQHLPLHGRPDLVRDQGQPAAGGHHGQAGGQRGADELGRSLQRRQPTRPREGQQPRPGAAGPAARRTPPPVVRAVHGSTPSRPCGVHDVVRQVGALDRERGPFAQACGSRPAALR